MSVPAGIIALWSGTLDSIPDGWLLCDGNNGTPNLIGRFVRGIPDASTNPGSTGGSDTHTHTETAAGYHEHTLATAGSHTHSVGSSGVHAHPYSPFYDLETGARTSEAAKSVGSHTHSISSSGAHSHTATAGSHSHSISTVDGRPPFYEVAFIQAQPGASLETGIIIIWAGTRASIPPGWVVCDGADGRPDLRGRFIRGINSPSTNPGTTGGATSHSHSEFSESHSHSSSSDGEHSHTLTSNTWSHDHNTELTWGTRSRRRFQAQSYLKAPHDHSTSTAGSHSHSLEIGGSHSHTINPASSLPSYYEVIFLWNSGAEQIPVGGIVVWVEDLTSLPSGYNLCDGDGGRPNLLGRFLRGAPADTDAGGTGGSDSHSHSESLAGSHSDHSVSSNGSHSHSCNSAGSHTHPEIVASVLAGKTVHCQTVTDEAGSHAHTLGSNGSHIHEIDEVGDHAHTINAASSLPAYYEVAFIQCTIQTVQSNIGSSARIIARVARQDITSASKLFGRETSSLSSQARIRGKRTLSFPAAATLFKISSDTTPSATKLKVTRATLAFSRISLKRLESGLGGIKLGDLLGGKYAESIRAYVVSAISRLSGRVTTTIGSLNRIRGDRTTSLQAQARLSGKLSIDLGGSARVSGVLRTTCASVSRLRGQRSTSISSSSRLRGQRSTSTGSTSRLRGQEFIPISSISRTRGIKDALLECASRIRSIYRTQLESGTRLLGWAQTHITSKTRIRGTEAVHLGVESRTRGQKTRTITSSPRITGQAQATTASRAEIKRTAKGLGKLPLGGLMLGYGQFSSSTKKIVGSHIRVRGQPKLAIPVCSRLSAVFHAETSAGSKIVTRKDSLLAAGTRISSSTLRIVQSDGRITGKRVFFLQSAIEVIPRLKLISSSAVRGINRLYVMAKALVLNAGGQKPASVRIRGTERRQVISDARILGLQSLVLESDARCRGKRLGSIVSGSSLCARSHLRSGAVIGGLYLRLPSSAHITSFKHEGTLGRLPLGSQLGGSGQDERAELILSAYRVKGRPTLGSSSDARVVRFRSLVTQSSGVLSGQARIKTPSEVRLSGSKSQHLEADLRLIRLSGLDIRSSCYIWDGPVSCELDPGLSFEIWYHYEET